MTLFTLPLRDESVEPWPLNMETKKIIGTLPRLGNTIISPWFLLRAHRHWRD